MSKNFYLISITETKKSTFSLLQDRAAWSTGFKVEYFYDKGRFRGVKQFYLL